MNVAHTVSSDIDAVDFTFLSPKEILAISAKRIENESTFDSLLNPVHGGLYDPALGSWGDELCATCNLNQTGCPGHPGHIQLSVPVYHPIFMDQTYLLLRAACVYCRGFRIPTKDIHKYKCKLRLLQFGLVHEAHGVDGVGESDLVDDTSSEADEEGASNDNAITKREKYVRQCLRGLNHRRQRSKDEHEGVAQDRREVIKSFLAEVTKSRQCSTCSGISPSYRKDRFVKIFEKSLSPKEQAKMAQKNLLHQDAMARSRHEQSKDRVEAESLSESTSINESYSDREVNVGPATSQRYISAMEVRARLNDLFQKEQDIVSLLYNKKARTQRTPAVSADMFFITTILVPPNRYRPEARMGANQVTEAEQNTLYKNILRSCTKIAHVHAGLSTNERSDMAQLHQACTELQEVVNALIDKNQNPVQGAAANRNGDGIKQKLEKKEGLFRKNMMGKRVNFAARSVISPDPNIETNEIGVPLVFATKLTFPEPVTSYNFKHMQQAVINGTDRWPGASAIEDENGRVQQLRNKTVDERISLANQLLAPTDFKAPRMRNKKVHRHMTNGDVVLMNRQPTLHKASVMGHRVRVLPGEKTIRMHYANCNAYNADFDGDEMNMHFPQNEIARAEALQIADTDHQYLSTTQGKPLRGLIQDHISVSIALCSRDALFSRGDYHALVYSAIRPESDYNLRQRIELVPPAIIKPVPRWSGKQVITTILKNIQPPGCGPLTLLGESQIKAQQWGLKSEEGTVHIQEGEFVTGILDKAQIGQSSGGLIHAAYEAYGPAVAGKLLTALGRLLTRYLQMRAFSCGMDDLRLSVKGETSRREELQATERVGYEIASNYVSIDPHSRPNDALLLERLEEVIRDDKKHEGLDLLMSQGAARITDAIQKACIPDALQKPFPQNQMQAMTTSGAKGSRVNASLISCNLGQQVLEGRRVPIMVSGKSLPCYKPFETNISANGFIGSRFLTGIRPQEYFFHHMAGREGLIDTAVKTSRSGYLQRCVIKGLEGLTVGYDSAVRDSDGSVIQFLYGEDGLDVTKQTYLKDFGFILRNLMSEASQLQFDPEVAKRVAANRSTFTKYMKSALKHSQRGDPKGKDPLSSAFNPATNAFVFSESFYDAMTSYLQHDAKGLIREKSNTSAPTPSVLLSRKNAELLFAMKYLRALAEPGEAVGIVAGQSIGEPSTQMTLNTFHLAGHAAKNVTAGIPRLREILMTASKDISTPTMSLYPRQQLSKDKVDAFVTLINALPLSHTLDCVNVEEKVGRGERYGLAKMYTVRLRFFPSKDYTDAYKIGISEVLDTVAKTLVRQIVTLSKAEIKKRATQEAMPTTDIGMSAGVVEFAAPTTSAGVRAQDDDDDDEEGNDENYSTAKQQNSRYEAVSYEPDDDADNEVQQAMVANDDSEADDVDTVGDLVSDEVSEAEISDRENRQKSKPRAEHVLETFQEVTHFDCDERSGEWCSLTLEFDASVPKLLMLDIVERAIKRTFVREIRGLGACKIVEEPSGKKELAVHVTGVNFKAVQQLGDYIDPDRIQSNDIAAILSAYGVEACRANIVKELGDVFGSHGIKVDYRHLSLIGDHMTRNGGFTAFSRIGLRGNVSPFTKMSFETTLAFLKDAVLDGDWDGLTTPSGRLVMGQLGKLGTGSFDVLTTLPTHVDTLA